MSNNSVADAPKEVSNTLFIFTAQPEFADAAFDELKRVNKRLESVEELAPGIELCEISEITAFMRSAAGYHPIFVRHLAPVQAVVNLTHSEADIATIAVAIADLPTFSMLERGQRFAVQSRIIQIEDQAVKHPYSSGTLNKSIAALITEETGAVESIKRPQLVVSILCTATKAYIGISAAEENLSDWPGGAQHFKHLPEQISRAEFKLLEALDVFGVSLPEHGRALDLGAAPGGWTRLLLEAGMEVVAVDPANLDPRLSRRQHLEHYRGYAEDYLDNAVNRRILFDVIANDMRMDAREAARLLVQAAQCLRSDGFVISVFKLPHATLEINPLKNLREALSLLSKSYQVVRAHQLFHNRQEVTVITAQPIISKGSIRR